MNNMSKQLRIWIDVDNSPHVPFFSPLIKEMEKMGCEVTITARDCFQTCGLLDMSGREYFKIGRHYGKNLFLKIAGLVIRAFQLYLFGRGKEFSVAVGHGSRSLILAAFLLRVPMVNMFDYEYSKFGPFLNRLATKQLLPALIPDFAVDHVKNVVKYPGLKEEVYIGDFKPDDSIYDRLGIDSQKVVVTVRPPATEAHYHQANSEEIYNSVIDYLRCQEDITVVVLPRNEKQRKYIEELSGDDESNIIIPECVVNGLNLLWHSDLVISGGGTMNREAAALGVPVYSIFGSEIGAIDKYLAASGRLELINKPEDVYQIKIKKSEGYACSYQKRQDLVDFLINEIVTVAKK